MTVKRVDATVKTVGDDGYPGEFEVCLSAPTVDRDNELVRAGAFHPLPDHLTFDVDHGLTAQTVVGSGKPFYDGERLMVRGTFARTELAQTVRSLVKDGHIRTTSVAMRAPKKEQKDGVTHIVKAELLNGSFVSIPSCREALVVAAKAGARNSAGDAGLIQQIHDEAVEAGAECPAPAGQDPLSVTAAGTIHALAVALGATCDGTPTADPASGDVTARGSGGNLREHALRLLEGTTTTKGGPVGRDEDDMWVRAQRLKYQVLVANLTADRIEALKKHERPSSWDATPVTYKGQRMTKSMATLLEETEVENVRLSFKDYGGATCDPGQPPVRCTFVQEPEPPSPEQLPPDQMTPVMWDFEHPVTIYDPDNLAVESVMGGFTESSYVAEADE